jgi:uncharacterized protein YkwD
MFSRSTFRVLTVTALCAGAVAVLGPASTAAAHRRHRHRPPAHASTCPGAAARPVASNSSLVREAVLCALNRERANRGLPRLVLSSQLSLAAEHHAVDMVRRQYFAHESPEGRDVVDRLTRVGYIATGWWMVGENLGWGTEELASPQRMTMAWMHSPAHRSNILDRGYRELGIAVVLGVPTAGGGLGATYVTEFGVRR